MKGIFFKQLPEKLSADPNLHFVIYDPVTNKDYRLKFQLFINLLQSISNDKDVFVLDPVSNSENDYFATIVEKDLKKDAVYIIQPPANNTGPITFNELPVRTFDGEELVDLEENEFDSDNTYLLIYKEDYWLKFSGSSTAPVEEDVFLEDLPVILGPGEYWGKWKNGDTIPALGKNPKVVIKEALTRELDYGFSSFSMSQTGEVETGTTVSGNKTFNWGINNGTAVITGIDIIDATNNNTVLLANTPNDGNQVVAITSVIKNSAGQTHSWRARANNSNTGLAPSKLSGDFTVVWRNVMFWGPTATTITTSTQARALPSSAFYRGGTTFILDSGNTLTKFGIVLEVGKSITDIKDLDALQAPLLGNEPGKYNYIGTVPVADANGNVTQRPYYEMNIAVPYSDGNHRHQITIN